MAHLPLKDLRSRNASAITVLFSDLSAHWLCIEGSPPVGNAGKCEHTVMCTILLPESESGKIITSPLVLKRNLLGYMYVGSSGTLGSLSHTLLQQ